MPLRLITGLPNTGRTEELKAELLRAAEDKRMPVLLVPSVDDVFVWERRLTRPSTGGEGPTSAIESPAGAFSGGRIVHFLDLCREIVRNADGAVRPIAGEVRRRMILEEAVAKTAAIEGGPAARVEGRTERLPGLVDAALELVDEYRAERVLVGTRKPAEDEPVRELREGIEPLVDAYSDLLESEGLADPPSISQRAIEVVKGKDRPDSVWGDAPLFIAGFDDMTGQQLELVRRLSNDLGIDVTMALTWREDKLAGFLTDRLKARLEEYIGIEEERSAEPRPADGSDGDGERGEAQDPGLAALAAAFFSGDTDLAPDSPPPVRLIRAAGERKEAEAIGSEIASLIAGGAALPDQIAVAHTDPGGSGRLLEGVLERYGIPATLETETPALATTVGAALAALLRAAARDGTADDLIVWLRGPLGLGRSRVDEIERDCRRQGIGSAGRALALIPEEERGDWEALFDRTRPGSERLNLLALLARNAGRAVLESSTERRKAGGEMPERPSSDTELEVRMAEAIASEAEGLAATGLDDRNGLALFLDALRKGEISVWTVPTQGTVRITGPWGLRAKRVRYLFVAGLQEGGTRDLTRAGPFMSTVQRDALGMLERVDPEIQARYLMFSCLTVPTSGLWLSCTTSDDSGKGTAPSPLIAEIEALCGGSLGPIERSGSDVSFGVGEAPTEAELTRSLAISGRDPDAVEVPAEVEATIVERLARAREMEELTRSLGSMTDREVLAELEALETFSPSEIEAWLRCPWTWFIDRRIRPVGLRPDQDYLAAGNIVHEVLEKLYREAPAGPVPGPDNVARWTERVPELFEEVLADDEGNPLAGDDPFVLLARLALIRGTVRFLEREAEQASEEFIPALLEAELEGVEMGHWKLRGKVDRVDTEGGQKPGAGVRSLVIDYKTGKVDGRYTPGSMETHGAVQIPLYMEALRRSEGIDPVAGFVLSVKDGADPRPRGPIPENETEVVGTRTMLQRGGTVDSVDAFLEKALDLADEAVAGIRAGAIEHEEGSCRKHFEDPLCLLPAPGASVEREYETEVAPLDLSKKVESEMGEAGFSFSDAQKRVIESGKSEIMVSAAAGSGKTSVTVERYKRLLLGDADPSSILVFTFTDQAAAKLREEVRHARSEASGDGVPVSMSDAWVGTFHSICSRILTAFPLEADIDPGFTVIDDITSSALRKEAFDRALTRRLEAAAEDGTDETIAILGQVSRVTLRDTVESLFDLLRSRGEEYPELDLDPTPPAYPVKELKALLGEVDRVLAKPEQVKAFKESQKDKCRALKRLIEGPRGGRLSGKDIKDLSFKNQDLETLISLRDTVQAALFACDGHPWLIEVGGLLTDFGREYALLKETRSALDFEDLQIKTLKLLTVNEAVREDYVSRFREIMVDEFQDTNQLQMKLIAALRGDDLDATRLMTVGDEMQAIYGFRHADVGIFRERRNRLSRDPGSSDLIELPHNYRSAPGILAAVNYLGERIHPNSGADDAAEGDSAEKSEDSAPSFARLEAGRDPEGDPPPTTLLLTSKSEWKDVDLGPLGPAEAALTEGRRSTIAEALAVAAEVHALVSRGEFEQRDIALLLRSTTALPVFEAALNQFGLRTVVPSSKGFWESRPVREIISLLSVVANPLDDEAVVATLTSPVCGIGADGLWRVRSAAGRSEPLWNGVSKVAEEQAEGDARPGSCEIANFRSLIEGVRAELDGKPLESLVSELLDRTGLDLANLIRDRNSLASLERVATLAGEYERQEGRNLRGFLDWAESSRTVDAEAAIAISGENDDAVKIMTIHKSKGLEFPVVCVADLGRPLKGGGDGPVRIDHEGDAGRMRIGLRLPDSGTGVFEWDRVEDRAGRENEAEELRLIHVAMTRAEERLILSGVVHPPGNGNPQNRPVVLRILEALGLDPADPDGWEASLASPEADAIFAVRSSRPDAEGRAPARLLQTFPVKLPAGMIQTAKPPLWRPERAFFPDVPLSFSGLLEFRECPARFFARRVLRMDVGPGLPGYSGPETTPLVERDENRAADERGGQKFGNAVHTVLERAAQGAWTAPGTAEIKKALRAEGLDPDEGDRVEVAMQMVDGFLESELGLLARNHATTVGAEVPIVLGIGGLTIRGLVDLLIEADGETWVVDYKTNDLGGRRPDELMDTYDLQRDLYSLAVARSKGLKTVNSAFVFLEEPGIPVVKAHGPEDLTAIEQRLRNDVVEPITKARYFGGRGEGPEPCGKCEACQLFGLGAG